MPFWVMLLITIAMTIAGQLLAPHPEDPHPDDKPNFPDIDETQPISVIWGECLVTPHLFWWGDYLSSPIKKKIFTGLWFKKITTGFKSQVGMALALGYGGDQYTGATGNASNRVVVTEFQVEDKVLWSGTPAGSGEGLYFSVDNPSFLGGNATGGNGGIKTTVEIHGGGPDAVRSTYLGAVLTNTSKWKKLAYLVWQGPTAGAGMGWFGNSSTLPGIKVKCQRYPMVVSDSGAFYELIGVDANPVQCLAELLVNSTWGAHDVTLDDLDSASWRAAASTLYTEGNGFSYEWKSSMSFESMADIILKQIDGVLYTDLSTGKIVIKLARADYDPDDLEVFDNDDFVSISELTRGSWDDTLNTLQVSYTDHSQAFKQVQVRDQDLANFMIQGSQAVVSNINYPGVSNGAMARQLARRDMKVLTLPLLRFIGTVDRRANTFFPGSVFKFSWVEEGITEVVMRVTGVKFGTLQSGTMELSCVEDQFGLGEAIFTDTATDWSDAVGDAVPVVNGATAELPYFYARDDLDRLFSYAERPNASQQSYQLVVDDIVEDDTVDFTPSGVLHADMVFESTISETVVVDDVTDINLVLLPTGGTDLDEGVSLALIDDEIVAFEASSSAGATDFTMVVNKRGMLDTVPSRHTAGARVWFLGTHFGRTETDYPNAHASSTVFLTNSLRGTLAPGDSDIYSLTMANRSARPLPPAQVSFNAAYYYDTQTGIIPDTGTITVGWARRNRVTQTSAATRYFDSDITPEYGQTVGIKIYGDAGTLIHTETGLTGTSFAYTNAQEIADAGALQGRLTFVVYSERDGLTSTFAVRIQLTRTGGSTGALPSYTGSGSFSPPPVPVAGLPVSTTPTDGQVLVWNAAAGRWEPHTISGTGGTGLTVEETDGSPSVTNVTKIKTRTGDLTNLGSNAVLIDTVADFDLVITDGQEVLVDDITGTGNILYYY